MMKITAICIAALGLICASAQAATQTPSSGTTVGAHAGAAFLGDSEGTHFSVGVNGSTPIYDSFFGGFDFSYIDRGGISSTAGSATGSLYLLNGSINYDTSAFYPGTFLGVAMGVGILHTSLNIGPLTTSTTNTNFYAGPRLGYDYSLSSSFTIGGQADWLITPATAAPNILEAIAVLKYWL